MKSLGCPAGGDGGYQLTRGSSLYTPAQLLHPLVTAHRDDHSIGLHAWMLLSHMGCPHLTFDLFGQCSKPINTGIPPKAENRQETEMLMAPAIKPGEVSASCSQMDVAVGRPLRMMPLKQKILMNTNQTFLPADGENLPAHLPRGHIWRRDGDRPTLRGSPGALQSLQAGWGQLGWRSCT